MEASLLGCVLERLALAQEASMLRDLGMHLKLPPWLEPQRAQLERLLPSLRLPGAGGRP